MNKTAIDWANWSWNPLTGCYGPGGKGPCGYCYARRIAERFGGDYSQSEPDPSGEAIGGDCVAGPGQAFPAGFLPTFYPHRLAEPVRVRKPARIFVCSMGDLFGEWVRADWINQVLSVITDCPQHSFLLLTKNPKRYAEFAFPRNAWLGATVTSEDDVGRVGWLSGLRSWVSYEPMLGGFDDHSWMGRISWVVMGAQTGPGAEEPYRDWVEEAIGYAGNHHLPLFIKSNLAPLCRAWGIPVTKDYPEGMVGHV